MTQTNRRNFVKQLGAGTVGAIGVMSTLNVQKALAVPAGNIIHISSPDDFKTLLTNSNLPNITESTGRLTDDRLVIFMESGTYDAATRLKIGRPVTLIGHGDVIIKTSSQGSFLDLWPTKGVGIKPQKLISLANDVFITGIKFESEIGSYLFSFIGKSSNPEGRKKLINEGSSDIPYNIEDGQVSGLIISDCEFKNTCVNISVEANLKSSSEMRKKPDPSQFYKSIGSASRSASLINCVVHDIISTGIHAGIEVNGVSGVNIEKCTIYNILAKRYYSGYNSIIDPGWNIVNLVKNYGNHTLRFLEVDGNSTNGVGIKVSSYKQQKHGSACNGRDAFENRDDNLYEKESCFNRQYAYGVVINNCRIEWCADDGIDIHSSSQAIVKDCFIQYIGEVGIEQKTDGGYKPEGTYPEEVTIATEHIDQNIICGNYITVTKHNGVGCSAPNTVVSNNTIIYTNAHGIFVSGRNKNELYKNISVTNNIIRQCGRGDFILEGIDKKLTRRDGIKIQFGINVLVSGNIVNAGRHNPKTGNGIHAYHSDRVSICDNKTLRCNTAGVRIEGSQDSCQRTMYVAHTDSGSSTKLDVYNNYALGISS